MGESDIGQQFLDKMLKLMEGVTPDKTIQKLPLDQQAALVTLFEIAIVPLMKIFHEKKEITASDLAANAALMFCLGHNWAVTHWALWSIEDEEEGG